MRVDRIRVGMIDTICYIVSSSQKNAIVIDPGDQSEKIIRLLERESLVPKMILLTHGHYDHIGAIEALKKLGTLPVYVGQGDEPMINGSLWESYLGHPFSHPTFDHILVDGQILTLDELRIKVISTPGHSPGSVSFVVGDAVFTGDTLFADGGVGRTDLWQGSSADLADSIRRKLFSLPGELTVYPGHGNASTIGREKALHQVNRS